MAEFVTELNDLFGGFKERAREVSRAFRGEGFAYVMVSTPVPAALDEAALFLDRLAASGLRGDALVLNRLHRVRAGVVSLEEAAEAARRAGLDPSLATTLVTALSDEDAQARFDARALEHLEVRLGKSPATASLRRIELPLLGDDPHDLSDLVPLSQRLV
jgi:hypothetical protein